MKIIMKKLIKKNINEIIHQPVNNEKDMDDIRLFNCIEEIRKLAIELKNEKIHGSMYIGSEQIKIDIKNQIGEKLIKILKKYSELT